MQGHVKKKSRNTVRIGVLMTAVKVCQAVKGREEIIQNGLNNSGACKRQ
jgi:hypothetical protein